MKLFVPFDIVKADDDECIVEGYASTEALDSQGEIVKREAMERALPEYMKIGNIREMHQPSAVGVAIHAEVDDTGVRLRSNVVDPVAKAKVRAGVYKGYSIGGKVTNRDKLNKAIITGLHLTEISLVDRPANPEALFDVWKADGIQDASDDAAKGMFSVQQLADILTQIKYLAEDSKFEELMEGDTESVVPDGLQDWLRQGGLLLGQMVTEEMGEMAPDEDVDADVLALAAAASTLAKGGKRNSKADQKKLNEAHDVIVDAGAECAAAKHADVADLAKAESDLAAAQSSLSKVQADLATATSELAASQVRSSEAETRFTELTKAHETTASALADLTKAHASIVTERDDLSSKFETATADVVAKDASLAAMTAELTELKARPEPIKGKLVNVAKSHDITPQGDRTPTTRTSTELQPERWFTARPA